MAQTRPQLAAPRATQTLEAVRTASGGWDADAWHVMNGRDDALVADEILHGSLSGKFLYQFKMRGAAEPVIGISVVGARHLAYHYGGLKHRIVATIQKTQELFTFTTYPHDGQPMDTHCKVIRELADQPDFFQAVVEVVDTQTGNAVQIEKREYRYDNKSDGSGQYEKIHFATIAQSKAYRNAILDLVPQDVQIKWRNLMVKDPNKVIDVTSSVIEEKRHAVLRFAAKQGLLVDRRAVEDLTLDQIAGLGDAARAENQMAFVNAARALKLDVNLSTGEEEEARAEPKREATVAPTPPPSEAQPRHRRGRPPKDAAPAAQQNGASPEPEPETTTEQAEPGSEEPDIEAEADARADEVDRGDQAPAQPAQPARSGTLGLEFC